MHELYQKIARLGAEHQACRMVLFGSRARGTQHERSDIDIAAYGVPEEHQAALWLALDELPTLLRLDLVFITPDTSPALLEQIKKDGVTLYEKNQAR